MGILALGLLGALLAVLFRRGLRRAQDLRGQVAIVTGASRGIGRATALALGAAGMRVVLTAPAAEAEALETIRDELAAAGAVARVVVADITQENDRQRLVVETQRELGRVEVLVNNTGVAGGGPLVDLPAEALAQMVQVNVLGTGRLTQLVLPVMLEQGRGHVVFVSSASAGMYMPGVGVYTATKAALRSFAGCLRRELNGTGVHVSTVLPAVVRTAMMARAMDAYAQPNGETTGVAAWFLKGVDSPEAVAQAIVDALRYRRREVWLGGLAVRAAVTLDTCAPGLLDVLFTPRVSQQIAQLATRLGAE